MVRTSVLIKYNKQKERNNAYYYCLDIMESPDTTAENEKTPLKTQPDVSVKFNESIFEV